SDQRAIALDHLETMLEHSSLYLLCLVQCWCEPLTTGKCEPAGHMYDIIAVFIGAFIGVFIIVNVQVGAGLTLYISIGCGFDTLHLHGCGFDTLHLHECGFDTLHLQWVRV
ncbi:hypothetical protein RRG08_066448, partial [Elysia crispata]